MEWASPKDPVARILEPSPARQATRIGDRRGGSQALHCISTCSSHRGQPQQISLATTRLITSFGQWAHHHLHHGTSGPAGQGILCVRLRLRGSWAWCAEIRTL